MPSIINATTSTGLVSSADNSGEIELQSNGTTALKVNTNEGIQILNCLGVGNATPSTSGAGITFPATQSASSDANTLDDYEEGTWTPTFSSSGGTITTYSASGRYTKIGRIVYLYASITVSNIGSASGIGNWAGAPFTSMAELQANAGRIAIFVVREDFNTGNMFQGYMNASNTNGNFLTTTNGSLTWTNGNIYEFSFTYQVA
jgi:hypothetical protein